VTLTLVLLAASLGLSNLAAAIGLGVAGVDARTRWRIGIVYGLFEAGMPVVGLLLGRNLAGAMGRLTHPIGAALLITTGLYSMWQAWRGDTDEQEAAGEAAALPLGRLLITGFALSVDNLAVGFALGTYRVDLLTAALVIGVVSVALSLLGLELGDRIGAKTGARGEWLGGGVLVAVGIL